MLDSHSSSTFYAMHEGSASLTSQSRDLIQKPMAGQHYFYAKPMAGQPFRSLQLSAHGRVTFKVHGLTFKVHGLTAQCPWQGHIH